SSKYRGLETMARLIEALSEQHACPELAEMFRDKHVAPTGPRSIGPLSPVRGTWKSIPNFCDHRHPSPVSKPRLLKSTSKWRRLSPIAPSPRVLDSWKNTLNCCGFRFLQQKSLRERSAIENSSRK